MMIGVDRFDRTSRQTSIPSLPGSIKSSKIRSGSASKASRTASFPSKAQMTS